MILVGFIVLLTASVLALTLRGRFTRLTPKVPFAIAYGTFATLGILGAMSPNAVLIKIGFLGVVITGLAMTGLGAYVKLGLFGNRVR